MNTFINTLNELKEANKALANAFNDEHNNKFTAPIEPVPAHCTTRDLVDGTTILVDEDGIYLSGDDLPF